MIAFWRRWFPKRLPDHPDGTCHQFAMNLQMEYSVCYCGQRLNPIEEPYTPPHEHAWIYDPLTGGSHCRCGTVRHPLLRTEFDSVKVKEA